MARQPYEGTHSAEDGYLSSDSSFYGDETLKQQLEAQAASFDPTSYWSTHDVQPSVSVFQATVHDAPSKPAAPVYNMYESYKSGRKLSETVPEFVRRLSPYSTQIAEYGPWIYVANPAYRDQPTKEDLRGLKQRGAELLAEFAGVREGVEASMAGKPKSAITRKISPLRTKLEQDIGALAREKGVTSGKWMLFPQPNDVNRVWAIVAQAVVDGELGHAAKVATDDGTGNDRARLICVYNEDFSGKAEVRRVLKRLDELGLVNAKGPMGGDRPIYYKADAFTHLDILGGNQWGLKPSMYSSKEVLDEAW